MVRQKIPYSHKQSRRPTAAVDSPFNFTYRLPLRHKLNTGNRARAPPSGRYVSAYRPLRTVPEEIHDASVSYDGRQVFDDECTRDRFQDDGGSEDEDENDLFEWDEETTLVAALMQEECSEDKMVNLANQLKAPMSAQSRHLKKHLAEVLVPAVNLVREVHAVIDQNVDVVIGNGIMTFDQSCKKMERVVVSSKSALTAAYLKTQQNVQRLFKELAEEYAKRDQLWTDLEHSINQSAEHALSELKEVPTKIERTISALEKHSKELDKDAGDSVKADKLIRQLLERLV